MDKISDATLRNFQKLKKNIDNHEFSSRANKRDSSKHILAIEYFSSNSNRDLIENIISRLSNFKNIELEIIIDSLIASYLNHVNLVKINQGVLSFKNCYIEKFYKSLHPNNSVCIENWPENEKDPVGIIYQFLMTEGEKNKKGSYYTPESIVSKLIDGVDLSNQTVCDPCCGSGSFLTYLVSKKIAKPDSVYGYDIDPIAVKLTIMNLFCLNSDIDYTEHIFCKDFLLTCDVKYDYFITNPPWGSMTDSTMYGSISEVLSGESFSYFLVKCLRSLGKGSIIFLLPISFLNVRVHSDVRKFICNNYSLTKLFLLNKCFKGVLTDVIGIHISKKDYNIHSYLVDNGIEKFELNISNIDSDKFYVIPYFSSTSEKIIEKIIEDGRFNLKEADFALGIVTGNNKELLLPEHVDGSRPILTGKEVNAIYALEPKNYIFYDREKFQQVCDDKYFAASSKLIYKFITKKLCFAWDNSSMLSLNSANILLAPKGFYVSDVCLAGLLSSAPMNFYFINKVNQIKVLKEDIRNLPLPNLSAQEISLLEKISSESFDKKCDRIKDINEILYSHYNFSNEEILKIEEIVYGRAN